MTVDDDIYDRALSREEFDAYVNAPMSDDERAGIDELLEWFSRRYPTPEARLAYVRRAFKRWTAKV